MRFWYVTEARLLYLIDLPTAVTAHLLVLCTDDFKHLQVATTACWKVVYLTHHDAACLSAWKKTGEVLRNS